MATVATPPRSAPTAASPAAASAARPPAGGAARTATLEQVSPTAAQPIPHDCETGEGDPADARRAWTGREVGIDLARGAALIGMMITHTQSAANAEGVLNPAWLVATGKSSALFAVVAGVGIALTSGRTRPPSGRKWVAVVLSMLARAVVIGAIGLALGAVLGETNAMVILPYYALLFVFAIPFLRLRVRWLVLATGVLAVGMPVLSMVLRADLPWVVDPANLTFGAVSSQPAASLTELLLTGAYPALPWLAYVCAGLAVGRSRLSMRGVAAGIAAIGLALALAARAVSWYLLDVAGGQEPLTRAATKVMSLGDYVDLLLFGSNGTTPVNSVWWLAVMSPHTATVADLVFTIGTSLLALGVCIMVGRVVGRLVSPLAAAGTMPLTMYVLHLLMLAYLPISEGAEGLEFVIQLTVLITFAMVWHHKFARGPLEQVIWWITDHIRRAVLGVRTGGTGALVRPAA
jgi:uncharacterized membrane protein